MLLFCIDTEGCPYIYEDIVYLSSHNRPPSGHISEESIPVMCHRTPQGDQGH